MFSAVAIGHKNQVLLVLPYFTEAHNVQDSQETPNVCLLALTSAASVREISILMTSARSEGGKREGGELSEQPQTYISALTLTWAKPAGFQPVSSGL